MGDGDVTAWLLLLVLLLPNLRTLSIRYIYESLRPKIIRLINDLYTAGMLQELTSLSLCGGFGILDIMSAPQELRLQQLKTMELRERSYRLTSPHGYKTSPDEEIAESFPVPQHLSEVTTLSLLGGYGFTIEYLPALAGRFKSLTSLSIDASAWSRDSRLAIVWDRLSCLKDTLEHLCISYDRNPTECQWNQNLTSAYLWPERLLQFQKLKVLEFKHGIDFTSKERQVEKCIDSNNLTPEMDHKRHVEQFFPPNIEELRITLDRIASGDVDHAHAMTGMQGKWELERPNGGFHYISKPLYDFLYEITSHRPSLKRVIVHSSMWAPISFHRLQTHLKKKRVELKMRNMEEERNEFLSIRKGIFWPDALIHTMEELDKERAQALTSLRNEDWKNQDTDVADLNATSTVDSKTNP